MAYDAGTLSATLATFEGTSTGIKAVGESLMTRWCLGNFFCASDSCWRAVRPAPDESQVALHVRQVCLTAAMVKACCSNASVERFGKTAGICLDSDPCCLGKGYRDRDSDRDRDHDSA